MFSGAVKEFVSTILGQRCHNQFRATCADVGCETWLVTNEIQRKIQTFVNRCLRFILRIWWPNIISNKDPWKVTGQEDINIEIKKRKFRWIGHTLRKEDGEIPKAAEE
jgi:hypothetical protein